jgi:hypothetical protein
VYLVTMKGHFKRSQSVKHQAGQHSRSPSRSPICR